MTADLPILFWDVDTQFDFMMPAGKLYVSGAEELLPALKRLTSLARSHRIPILASADDHLPGDAELSDEPDFKETFPPHCMSGTPGAERVEATQLTHPLVLEHEPWHGEKLGQALDAALAGSREILVLKRRFDVFTNPNAEAAVEHLAPRRIVLYGVALDVCNKFALEGLWQRGHRNLELVVDAAKAIDPEQGEGLLERWRKQGIRLTTVDEVAESLT